MATTLPRRRSLSGRLLLFGIISALVVAADQWTKQLATELLFLSGTRSVAVIGEYIRFTYVENRGAAFGLLQNQTAFFILVGIVVITVIALSFRYMQNPGIPLVICLGLQMGGAIGNLIDRIRSGFVVDFIDLTFWPVFNLADSAIVVGVILLAYQVAIRPIESPSSADNA